MRTRRLLLAVPAAALVGLALVPSLLSAPSHATPHARTASTAASVSSAASAPHAPTTAAAPAAWSPVSPVGVTARGCRSGRVALTFDDGPNPAVTPQLIKVLRSRHVPATFFMIGSHVAANPELAAQVAAAGFTIGNHTWDHPDLTTRGPVGIRRELLRTARALKQAVPAADREAITHLARPPYGATDAAVTAELRQLHLTSTLWNVDSRDWSGLTPPQILASVISQVEQHGTSGSVVLQHDGVANSPATLATVPREIRQLRRAGYCFVPLGADGQPSTRTPR